MGQRGRQYRAIRLHIDVHVYLTLLGCDGWLQNHQYRAIRLYIYVHVYLTLLGCDGWLQDHLFRATRNAALNSQRFAALIAEHHTKTSA